MSAVVLDTSALFVFLHKERGAESVERYLTEGDCLMSTVNEAEFVAKLRTSGVEMSRIEALLDELPLELVPFDHEQAIVSGELAIRTRAIGLSLGDRACLALGKQRRLRIVTADRAWLRLADEIEIECVRD